MESVSATQATLVTHVMCVLLGTCLTAWMNLSNPLASTTHVNRTSALDMVPVALCTLCKTESQPSSFSRQYETFAVEKWSLRQSVAACVNVTMDSTACHSGIQSVG